ncbi:MAG: polysaccharide biosynthesis C-terminal domain-containing protein [Oscillospiraceae bacterium]|jgi:Na+-driven multidrug efflux pump|nr:polysaccharide biosynthesis C-terminal domain-containing protein [Oscillospiraceae bacterium]
MTIRHKDEQNNTLIHRSILSALPAGFLSMLTLNFSTMVDTVLAGTFFTGTHIAAIGICLPFITLVTAIINIFGSGAVLALTINIGRGNRAGANRMFSLALTTIFLGGALFIAITALFSRQIVQISGAREAEAAALAESYLIWYCPALMLTSLNHTLGKLLSAHGLNTEAMLTTIFSMAANVLLSILLAATTRLGLPALALGTSLSTIATAIIQLAILRHRKVKLKFGFYRYSRRDYLSAFKRGLPSSGDQIAMGLTSGIINNVLVSNLGVISIAVFSVTDSIYRLALTTSQGIGAAGSPLFALLYGARDRNGIKQVFSSSFAVGLLITLAWCLVVLAAMPLWYTLYGVTAENGLDRAVILPGVLILMSFFPIVCFNRLLTYAYEATEQFTKSLLNSIAADSFLYPIFLLILLPRWGYLGLWLTNGFSYIALYLLFFGAQSLLYRRPVKSLDDILSLPPEVRDNIPKLDITITGEGSSISGLSERVQGFLKEHGFNGKRSYMTALCLEELAVDLSDNYREPSLRCFGSSRRSLSGKTPLMDIKLFADGDNIRVNIRSSGAYYNPLDFKFDDETLKKVGVRMAQSAARKIKYNYMYKMNVIDIVM